MDDGNDLESGQGGTVVVLDEEEGGAAIEMDV